MVLAISGVPYKNTPPLHLFGYLTRGGIFARALPDLEFWAIFANSPPCIGRKMPKFSRAFGALPLYMHSKSYARFREQGPFCAAGKKKLSILALLWTDFPLEMTQIECQMERNLTPPNRFCHDLRLWSIETLISRSISGWGSGM